MLTCFLLLHLKRMHFSTNFAFTSKRSPDKLCIHSRNFCAPQTKFVFTRKTSACKHKTGNGGKQCYMRINYMLTHFVILLSLTEPMHLHSLPKCAIFVLTHKTFQLPWQTLHSLMKKIAFPWTTFQNFCIPKKLHLLTKPNKHGIFLQNVCIPPTNFAFAHKTGDGINMRWGEYNLCSLHTLVSKCLFGE